MSALWRARIGSFLAGSGVTAIAAFAVLRQDLATNFKRLGEKIQGSDTASLEQRIHHVEEVLAARPPANSRSE